MRSHLVGGHIWWVAPNATPLKVVSDEKGNFRFTEVKRDTPWLELYYTGERIPAQRYSNLREFSEAELQELEFLADRPCELKVVVDGELYPTAAQLQLSAEGWNDGVNSIKMPFSYKYRELEAENVFANLPPGSYQISVMSEKIPLGNGGFTTKTLASKSFNLEPGQELKISF